MEENWNIVLSVLESPDPSQVGYQKVFTTSPVRIGRAEDSDFVLNDPAVSRTHAALRITNDLSRVFLTDSSTHGTVVEGRQVPKGLGSGFTIQDGETMRLGGSLVRFELNVKQSLQPTIIAAADRSFLDPPDQAITPDEEPAAEEILQQPAAKSAGRASTLSIITIIVCILFLLYLALFR
jgi:pSer/pThr/pTyr-binding forkhead associated (FHA) protein